MLTNSSFKTSSNSSKTASVYLFPSSLYIPELPITSEAIEEFVRAFVLPIRLHAAYDSLRVPNKASLLRQPEYQQLFNVVKELHDITVLICGHGGRDVRCGVMGPVLQQEFADQLGNQGIEVLSTPPEASAATKAIQRRRGARIGLISHIGGHKYAGNVIIYFPPSLESHPLAGKGIWYGRVEPKHVEGIIRGTVGNGKVISDMFRGGINKDGGIIRL